MSGLPQILLPALAGFALSLAGCRPGIDPNFEAVVSIAGEPGIPAPRKEVVAAELRERAKVLSLALEIDAGSPADGKLTLRFEADDKNDALARLDALCQSGKLAVRAVHEQTVFLSDAARSDPSRVPAGYEILPLSLQVGEASRSEELVVSTAIIIDGSHVERARAVPSKHHSVHISLTVSGGRQLMKATKKMQKGRSRLAIIYDGRIISAPVVAAVLASDFTIEGFNSFGQAQALAAALNKPLSTKLLIESLKPLAP